MLLLRVPLFASGVAAILVPAAAGAIDEDAREGTASVDNADIEIVKSVYASFGRGDLPAIPGALSPDVTWGVVGKTGDYPTFGIVTGVPAVETFVKTVSESHRVAQFLTNEFHASGGMVFVLGHYELVILKTGKPVSTDLVHVFTIKDGKVAPFREFIDTASVVDAYRERAGP